MDSLRVYNELVHYRKHVNPLKKGSPGTHKHHIIPACVGGGNEKENLVVLTTREHFIAHLLLWEIYTGTKYGAKLAQAYKRMADTGKYGKGSRAYARASAEAAAGLSGENAPWSKLTNAQRQQIRDEYNNDPVHGKKAELAKKYGVTRSLICGIINSPSGLSSADKQEIRDRWENNPIHGMKTKLVKEYNVSPGQIGRILKQKVGNAA